MDKNEIIRGQEARIARLETEVLSAALSDRLDMEAGGSPLTWKEVAERGDAEIARLNGVVADLVSKRLMLTEKANALVAAEAEAARLRTEITRERASADIQAELKWRNHDRAEATEAENAALRDALNGISQLVEIGAKSERARFESMHRPGDYSIAAAIGIDRLNAVLAAFRTALGDQP